MPKEAPLQDNQIRRGSTVKYKDGYYRVSACFTKTANLAQIFGSKIYHRSVPLSDVREAYQEWYDLWSQSETYKCM